MTWEEVCDDPALQDLPYKIELDQQGCIEMSPARNRRSHYQGEIAFLLRTLKTGGTAFPEHGTGPALPASRRGGILALQRTRRNAFL